MNNAVDLRINLRHTGYRTLMMLERTSGLIFLDAEPVWVTIDRGFIVRAASYRVGRDSAYVELEWRAHEGHDI